MTNKKSTARQKSAKNTTLDNMIVGQSPAMLEIKRHITHLSQTDLTVCIMGESGTGKELVAHAIHELSSRKNNPFIKINCAAIPPTLFESELFGFEKGAFTGAVRKKRGKFAQANSGTIFLDEIAEIPIPLQSKLLQVLEDKAFYALGDIKDTDLDVRVLVATNADLNHMVAGKRFRPDLFYRIMAAPIQLPPLRQRKEDLPDLCNHFVSKYADVYGWKCETLSAPVRQGFLEHDWPGNVRELENAIRSIMTLGDEDPFLENGINSLKTFTLKEVCKKAVCQAERQIITEALSHTNWNRRNAAILLQTSYRTLLNKLKEYDIGHN